MEKITEKDLEKLKIVKGQVRGIALKDDFEFIRKKRGEEGVQIIEQEMERLGYPLKYKEIKSFKWYPEKMNLLLFVAQKIFEWDNETMREMGRFGAKVSIMSRIMMRYFISIQGLIKVATDYWGRYHSTGNLVPIEVNKKQRYGILEIRNFTACYPSHCRYLEGYFWQIVSYVLPKQNLKVEEIACEFKGDKVHRFKITW